MVIDLFEVRAIVRNETKRTGVPLRDEDLEQDASLKAVEAFRREYEVRYPRAFLRKVVVDAVRDHWRRRWRISEDLDGVEEHRVATSVESLAGRVGGGRPEAVSGGCATAPRLRLSSSLSLAGRVGGGAKLPS